MTSQFYFPPPRAPTYKRPDSKEEFVTRAKQLLEKADPMYAGYKLGSVNKGDRVEIVTVPDQDPDVAEGVAQAMRAGGASDVRFIQMKTLMGSDPELHSVEEGWKEVVFFEECRASGSHKFTDLLTGREVGKALQKRLDENPDVTGVYFDVVRKARITLGKHSEKFRGMWLYNNWEEFSSRAWTYPTEVWKEYERRIIELVAQASAVRITDPEGTLLEWNVDPEGALRWQQGAWSRPGHLNMEPLMATSAEPPGAGRPDVAPVFSRVNGKLCGTANHCGFFPRIEVYFRNGRVVDVKGGGKYGDGIRRLMDKYSDVQWPSFPEKGLFWFCDCALCTNPKAFRRTSDMFKSYWLLTNFAETYRAGVIHMGFGCRRHGKVAAQYADDQGIPTGHIHVHNYFATYEVKLRGTESWVRIVDKGNITFLSDPAVRAVASKYGSPDELLTPDWIPPVPGINCEGDYWTEYAPNPAAYLKKRKEENQPI